MSPEEMYAQHWGDKKGKDKVPEREEGYEMQPVDKDSNMSFADRIRMPTDPEAPVLQHPGYGRAGLAPRHYYPGLTEADAARGDAL